MTTMRAVACPVCGGLCDDIELTIEDGRIVKVKNGCSMCETKFLHYCEHRLLKPLIRKSGELVKTSFKEALEKTAKILAEAAYPLLYGWGSRSCQKEDSKKASGKSI